MGKRQMWTAEDIPTQSGKLALVTGASGGVGFETALALAKAGASVIVAARNAEKARRASEHIRAVAPSADVRVETLDLASLASIEALANRLIAKGQPIDLLVNNAGVMAPAQRKLTQDGFELQLGTNHLGHFALTGRLLQLLRRAPTPRVVTVSSTAHKGGRIDFDDLQCERSYHPFGAYRQSKLANLLFSFELDRRSVAGHWGIVSVAAHPGYARTELIANGPEGRGPLKLMDTLLGPLFAQTAAEAARASLFAATAPDAARMGYYGPTRLGEMFGPVGQAFIASRARDEQVAQRLWAESVKLTGVPAR
jgi:NAD(P)-dependent dehydrogenase (short-subunit alcohol dehydrogenase family)